VGHAKVFEHLQHFVHVGRNTNSGAVNPPSISEPRPLRSAFSGLFVAALIASFFWGGLALLILRLR
jgi:hypothetical protein